MIDLHTHSTASDGSLTPSALVVKAAAEGLSMIALTDHDTVTGIPEFLETAAATRSLEGVGGVEISSQGPRGAAHILGYGVRGAVGPALAETLEWFRKAREHRGRQIVERLGRRGIAMDYAEVVAESGGEVVGRPHVARVLIKKGVVATTYEAFAEYLGEGGAAFVKKHRQDALKTVQLLRDEGLVPVLAHISTLRLDDDELSDFVGQLRDGGLMGIESYYPSYSQADMTRCRQLTARYGLIATGGSDFHGDVKPQVALGRGYGRLRVPPALGERLKRTMEQAQAGKRSN